MGNAQKRIVVTIPSTTLSRSWQIFYRLASPLGQRLRQWRSSHPWQPLAFTLAIALFLAGTHRVTAQQVWRGSESVPLQKAYEHWQQKHILYLAETHDSVADHQAQLLILQELQRRGRPLAIALEMIQRPFQAALDAYIAGEMTEMELLEQTQYAQRWGFPWSLYAPIFRFAKEQQIPLIALNTPTEVTRQVARQGLESLGEEDFRYIPPLRDIDLSNTAYRDRLQEIFVAAHQGVSHSMNFDFFYQAQVLWDETMAKVIAKYHQRHPDRLIVVLTGRGHVYFGDGIPQRVQRRLSPNLRQAIILLNPTAMEKAKPRIADWFWQNDPSL
ncbi:ChaN family lipoprotein [Thermosynechococcus sichuanensis E542]|uniref:ChaN family lipoprotein n=1 Tax=Thermosynechococcus sichuanensis E542 TaxID=2016101 RepID=A0A3B7MGC3_9CYAN|nr:ChaN family lipoprotein [Thermosynechococcus vestitus E542]